VKDTQPSTLTVAIGAAAADEDETFDFRLPSGFGAPDLQGVLRHAEEKLRLVRELTALRSSGAAAEAPAARADEPWDGAAFGRVLKEFTRAFAAGFHLPRVLEMFLDAIGELVRPTRTAPLLPDAEGRDYRVAA